MKITQIIKPEYDTITFKKRKTSWKGNIIGFVRFNTEGYTVQQWKKAQSDLDCVPGNVELRAEISQ